MYFLLQIGCILEGVVLWWCSCLLNLLMGMMLLCSTFFSLGVINVPWLFIQTFHNRKYIKSSLMSHSYSAQYQEQVRYSWETAFSLAYETPVAWRQPVIPTLQKLLRLLLHPIIYFYREHYLIGSSRYFYNSQPLKGW